MTDLINSLEALAGKVTPGDWAVGPYYIGTGPDEVMRGMILTDGDWPTGIICENDPPCGDTLSLDLDLICLLRNNLPTIIAALKPDPLAQVAREMVLLDGVVRTDNQKAAIREGRAANTAADDFYDRLRTALAARGLKLVEAGDAD